MVYTIHYSHFIWEAEVIKYVDLFPNTQAYKDLFCPTIL